MGPEHHRAQSAGYGQRSQLPPQDDHSVLHQCESTDLYSICLNAHDGLWSLFEGLIFCTDPSKMTLVSNKKQRLVVFLILPAVAKCFLVVDR